MYMCVWVFFYTEKEHISLRIVRLVLYENVHPKHLATVMGVSADSTDFPQPKTVLAV